MKCQELSHLTKNNNLFHRHSKSFRVLTSSRLHPNRSRATRQVVCNAEGVKAFARNAAEKAAAAVAASALIAGVSSRSCDKASCWQGEGMGEHLLLIPSAFSTC